MKIHITRRFAHLDIAGCSNDILKALDTAFSYAVSGAFFTGRTTASGGKWDGKTHLFSKVTGKFNVGLVDKVATFLRSSDIDVEIVDERPYKKYDLSEVNANLLAPIVSMSGSYTYQYKAIRRSLRARNGILWMATNAGKTNVMAGMIKIFKQQKSNNILIIVPNKKKLAQDTLRGISQALGVSNIGFIGNGIFKPQRVTVAMIGSLYNSNRHKDKILCDYLQKISVLFVDECHHVKSKSYKHVLRRLAPVHRYGMSGSPFTGSVDDLYTESCFGSVVYKIRNKKLIKLGVSAVPTVEMVVIDEPSDLTGDFAEVYNTGIVNNLYRNARIVQDIVKDYKKKQPVFVMVRTKEHGHSLGVMLKAKKIPHKFVYGTRFPGGVSAINFFFKEFEKGNLPVIIATTGLVDEGLNIKNIQVLVIADGYKSSRLLLQKIGRALRKKTGTNTNTVLIRDYADATHRYLADHALSRIEIYTHEGFKFKKKKQGVKE